MRQITRTITPAAALIAALGLGGCVADKPAARPIQPPEQLRPDLIVIGVQPLLDDDNNGYPDTIPLIVYIWDERYPLPLWVDGSMHFEMLDESGGRMAEWEVPAEVVQASRRRDQVGAVHHMVLDIRDAISDVIPLTNVRLRGDFSGAQGEAASTKRPIGFQVGS